MPHESPEKNFYPLFLDLSGLHCLVAGLGGVGSRKLQGLLHCAPASILALDMEAPAAELRPLLEQPCVRFEQRPFRDEDLDGRQLVFAATGNAEVNRHIALLCRERHILCNCIDAPAEGSFIVPAVARSGSMALALSTGGASPALSRRWKGELTTWLEARQKMVRLMGRLRPMVLALHDETGHNTALFRALAQSSLQDHLQQGDRQACLRCLQALLPPKLHDRIPELLDVIA